MTNEEALIYFKKRKAMCIDDRVQEAENIAIECIETQIPRKPIVWNNGTKHCSVCDAELDLILNKRFCECGQAIDWSSDNE